MDIDLGQLVEGADFRELTAISNSPGSTRPPKVLIIDSQTGQTRLGDFLYFDAYKDRRGEGGELALESIRTINKMIRIEGNKLPEDYFNELLQSHQIIRRDNYLICCDSNVKSPVKPDGRFECFRLIEDLEHEPKYTY